MPKKRQVTFKSYGTSSFQHNNSSSAHDGTNGTGADSSTQTVNQRLSALRILPTAEANIKKQQLADQANQRSVPPHLRGILGVSDSAPPRPKTGIRFRDRMRTPGPPAPRSWLSSAPAWRPNAAMGRRKNSKKAVEIERRRPETLFRFDKSVGESPECGAGSGLLLHMTLKRMAQSWELLDEDDYPALSEIPLRLRLRLLTYLGFYGPTIDITALQALTQGSEAVKSLDLSGLVGHGLLTLKRVARMLEADRQKGSEFESDVAESWDAGLSTAETLTLTPNMSRFRDLTKLCLSHPPPTILWQDLLNLSKHIPQVTHLSLAYWPRPTLTPNLATATVSSQHGPDINAGGSNLYSTIEADREEPAALLKQLSSHTLCLQWLDLEGCADWSPALSFPIEQVNRAPRPLPQAQQPLNDDVHWSQTSHSAMTIFCDTWKNVRYINLTQAGPPPTLAGINAQTPRRGDIFLETLIYMQLHTARGARTFDTPANRDVLEAEKRFAAMWLERESGLHQTAQEIEAMRRRRKMDHVVFEFGWK